MRYLRTASVMFLFWLALSGEFTALLLLSGAAAALLVAALARPCEGARPVHAAPGFIVRFLAYLPWLFWQIVLANLDLAYRALHPGKPIDPRIIKIKNPCRTAAGLAVLANSITLTPGTVTLDADDRELVIHAVSAEAAAALLGGEMQARVRRIEGEAHDV